MPLQIRRGTNAQRQAMTQALAQGELLYVTDDQRLYIGNGNTLGGVQITGYTNEDAQDAAAQLFAAGTHTGITFTYNDAAGSISALVDLLNNTGTIGGVFKGNVVAEDSTLLIDAALGQIVGPVFANVTGNVTGNITGNVLGNVTGNINGVVTGTVGSSIVGNLTGDTSGFHTGDVKGSVFADDSTLLVDGVSGQINGSVLSDVITPSVSIVRATSTGFALEINGITDVVDTSSGIEFLSSGGSLSTPTDLNINDRIFMLVGKAWKQDQGDYMLSTVIEAVVDSAYIGGQDVVPTKLIFYTSDGTRDFNVGNLEMSLDGDGKLSAANIEARNTFNLPVFANTGARDAAILTPIPGMMIFVTGTGMQVRGATSWNTIAGTAT